MPIWSAARPVVLVAVASLLAGCATAGGSTGSRSAAASSSPSPAQATLQLRLVDSSTDGPCSEPPLMSSAPGRACGSSGTTTYQMGASLADVTPTSVTSATGIGDATRQVFTVEFDEAGTTTLADVTRGAVGKVLALVVDGTVLSAPHVAAPITGGRFELATSTPDEAAKVAAALHATAASS